jgi:hypothetical protein
MQEDLFPKNAFGGIFNNNINSEFSTIERAIENGKLDEARTILDALIKDDSDLTKKHYLSLINKKLDFVKEEEKDIHLSEFHGTDITTYLAIESKLKTGSVNANEYEELLTFWHSYPAKRPQYRIDIYKHQISNKNLRGINPELIWLLIDKENRLEFKYFYILFLRYNDYIDAFKQRELRKYLDIHSIRLGKEIYSRYLTENVLPAEL